MMTHGDGKLEATDSGRTCAFCKGRTFRRSRLQFKDLMGLLAFQYPVRCLSCSKRQSVGLETARRAVPSTVRQVRAPKSTKLWDGSPWSQPQPPGNATKPTFLDGGVVSDLSTPVVVVREPVKMPDLHGVTLPHVAQMPPGNGENLA